MMRRGDGGQGQSRISPGCAGSALRSSLRRGWGSRCDRFSPSFVLVWHYLRSLRGLWKCACMPSPARPRCSGGLDAVKLFSGLSVLYYACHTLISEHAVFPGHIRRAGTARAHFLNDQQ